MQDSQQKWDHTVHMAKLGAAALGHLPKSTWVWAKPPVLQRIRWISQKTLQRNLREKKHVSPAAAFLIIFAGTTFFQCHEQVLQIWMDGISNPSVWVAFETTCEKALPLKKRRPLVSMKSCSHSTHLQCALCSPSALLRSLLMVISVK